MEKERIRNYAGRILYIILLISVLLVFLVSMYKILLYVWELTESWKVTEDMIQKAVKTEMTDDTQQDAQENMETAPISVDFESLWKENEDIVAWIYCPDTPVNYPVVQADDNEYYLDRLINGERNPSGTIFLDCRNSSDFSDINSVIYGHNMKNNSMFGTLTDYNDQEYYDKHPVMYLLTPDTDYKVELYVGHVTPENAECYAFPTTDEIKARVLINGKNKTTFLSQASLKTGDRLLTLSTCTYEYDEARYILIGLLRELGKKSTE